MKKLIPKTLIGKLWVLLLIWASSVSVFMSYQSFGDGFGLAFIIDLLIRIVFNYALFYSLPVAIYTRQRDYFKNKKDNSITEEE